MDRKTEEESQDQVIEEKWIAFSFGKDEESLEEFTAAFLSKYGHLVDLSFGFLSHSEMEEGPSLDKFPGTLLTTLSEFMKKIVDQTTSKVTVRNIRLVAAIIKCLIALCRNSINIINVASYDFVSDVIRVSQSVINQQCSLRPSGERCDEEKVVLKEDALKEDVLKEDALKEDVLKEDALRDFVSLTLYFMECLYDPQYLWRHHEMSISGQVGKQFKPALLDNEVTPFLYGCLLNPGLEERTLLDLLHTFGAIISGSEFNAVLAITPATLDIVLNMFANKAPSCLHVSPEVKVKGQRLASICLIQMLNAIFQSCPDQRQVEEKEVLQGYLHVLLDIQSSDVAPNVFIPLIDQLKDCVDSADRLTMQTSVVDRESLQSVVSLIDHCKYQDQDAQTLATAVINVLHFLLMGSSKCKATFQKYVGHKKLFASLLRLGIPTLPLVNAILNWIVEGDIAKLPEPAMRNASAAVSLLKWVKVIQDPQVQVHLSEACRRACTASNSNCRSCCGEGMLEVVLSILTQHEKLELKTVGNLIQILERLGSLSISPGELKQLISLMNPDAQGRPFPYTTRLMRAISTMARRDGSYGPLHFFDIQELENSITMPTISKWPGPGFSFFAWVCLDVERRHSHYEHMGPGMHYRRLLYSVCSDSGNGFEAFIGPSYQLTVATLGKKDYTTATTTTMALNDGLWHSIAIVQVSSRRFSHSPGHLYVYIDGNQTLNMPFKYPVITEPFVRCQIGSPGSSHGRRTSTEISTANANMEAKKTSTLKYLFSFASRAPAATPDGIQTIAAGLQEETWGPAICLYGQIENVCLFHDALQPEQARALNLIGPNSLFHCSDNQAIADLPSKILARYSAKACKGQVCADLSPRQNHGVFLGVHCVHWDIKDVIHSLGGIQVLFPLLEHLDQSLSLMHDWLESPRSPGPGEVQDLDMDDWVMTEDPCYADLKLEHNQLAAFLTMLRCMLKDKPVNRDVFIKQHCAATLGMLIQKVPRALIDVNVLMAVQYLVEDCDDHQGVRSTLLQHINHYILFDFSLWSHTQFAVRIGHIQYISTIIKDDRKYFRKKYGVQFFLDVIKEYYCTTKESGLSEEDSKTIRVSLMSLIKFYIHKEIRAEELNQLMAFLLSTSQSTLLLEAIDVLLSLLSSGGRRQDQLVLLLYEPEQSELLYKLLTYPNQPIIFYEKVVKLLFLLLKSERVYEKSKSRLRLADVGYAGLVNLMTSYDISAPMIKRFIEQVSFVETSQTYSAVLAVLSLVHSCGLDIKSEASRQLLAIVVSKPTSAKGFSKCLGWQEIITRLFAVDRKRFASIDSSASASTRHGGVHGHTRERSSTSLSIISADIPVHLQNQLPAPTLRPQSSLDIPSTADSGNGASSDVNSPPSSSGHVGGTHVLSAVGLRASSIASVALSTPVSDDTPSSSASSSSASAALPQPPSSSSLSSSSTSSSLPLSSNHRTDKNNHGRPSSPSSSSMSSLSRQTSDPAESEEIPTAPAGTSSSLSNRPTALPIANMVTSSPRIPLPSASSSSLSSTDREDGRIFDANAIITPMFLKRPFNDLNTPDGDEGNDVYLAGSRSSSTSVEDLLGDSTVSGGGGIGDSPSVNRSWHSSVSHSDGGSAVSINSSTTLTESSSGIFDEEDQEEDEDQVDGLAGGELQGQGQGRARRSVVGGGELGVMTEEEGGAIRRRASAVLKSEGYQQVLDNVGVEMSDTLEQKEELCQNILVCLVSILWKGLDGSSIDTWQERCQVFTWIDEWGETHSLIRPMEEIKRRLLEMLLHNCVADIRMSGQAIHSHSQKAMFLIQLVQHYVCESEACKDRFSHRLLEDVMTLLDVLGVWDTESPIAWTEIVHRAISILLAFSQREDLELVSAATVKLHSLVQTKLISSSAEASYILGVLQQMIMKALQENTDCYAYYMPVLRALMDKGNELLSISTNLPHLPPTAQNPTFFDDFKAYIHSDEWKSFMDNYVFPQMHHFMESNLEEGLVSMVAFWADCREIMLTNHHNHNREIGESRLKFMSQIDEVYRRKVDQEHRRFHNVHAQHKNQHLFALRTWRANKKFFTSVRGVWMDRHPPEVYWKLSNQENFARMKVRLTQNYNFDDHNKASRLRDNIGAVTSSHLVKLEELKGVKEALVSKEDIADDALGDEEWSAIDLSSTGTEEYSGKEKLITYTDCDLVTLVNIVKGRLELTTTHVYFFDCSNRKDEVGEDFKWSLNKLREIHFRRYNLRRSALELFFVDQTNYFINFPQKSMRNKIYSRIISLRPLNLSYKGQRSPADLLRVSGLTQKWVNHEISNFEYLMQLNTIAGRTYNDLSQYPVFPWILVDYTSSHLDLENKAVFRDLSKPVGVLNPRNEAEIREKYDTFEDPSGVIEKFHFGTHYSNAASVMHYMVRMEPFTSLHINLQSGKFDVSDRQFYSIPGSFNSLMENPNDTKELIPEFFYLPEFLVNSNGFDLGQLQITKERVNDITLPRWASTPEEFIHKHRQALECEYVSQNLHNWIDLIFGYKQKGPAAEEALNVFYYCTYEGAVDLDAIQDPKERASLEGMISNFGQTPSQLLKEPHPKRLTLDEAVSRQGKSTKPMSVFHSLKDLKPFFVEVSNDLDPLVFVNVPKSQSRSILQQGMPDTLVTVTEDGIIGTHGWLPFDRAISNFYTFDKDVTMCNDKTKKRAGGPFCPGLQVTTNLFVVSHDSKLLFVAGYWDNSLQVFNLGRLRMVNHLIRHIDIVTCLAIDNCGRHLVSGSRDTTCMVWEIIHQGGVSASLNPKPMQTLYGHSQEVTCVYISTELDIVVSASKDGTINLHTVLKGHYVMTLTAPCQKGWSVAIPRMDVSDIGHIVLFCTETKYGTDLRVQQERYSLHLYSINGKHLFSEPLDHAVGDMRMSGDNLVLGTQAGQLMIMEIFGLRPLTCLELLVPIQCVTVTNGNSHILAGLKDGKLIIVGNKGK